MSDETPAGWYPDPQPEDPGLLRWWDGSSWTENTHSSAQGEGAAPPSGGPPSGGPPSEEAPLTLMLAPEDPPARPAPSYEVPPQAPAADPGLLASAPAPYPSPQQGTGSWQQSTAQAAASTSGPGQWSAQDEQHAQEAARRAQLPGAMSPEEYIAAGAQILAQGPASVGRIPEVGAAPTLQPGSGGPAVVFGSKPIGPAPGSSRGRKPLLGGAAALVLGVGGFLAFQASRDTPPPAPAPAPTMARPANQLPTKAEADARGQSALAQGQDVLAYREARLGQSERGALAAEASLDQCVRAGAAVIGGGGRVLESPSEKTRIQHAVVVAADKDLTGREQSPQYRACLVREGELALEEAGILGAAPLTSAPLAPKMKTYGSLTLVRADRLVANTPGGGRFYVDQIVLRGPQLRSSVRITGEEALPPEQLEALLTALGARTS